MKNTKAVKNDHCGKKTELLECWYLYCPYDMLCTHFKFTIKFGSKIGFYY